MTQPRLFIVESLTLKDEKADRFDGGHLSKILTLSGAKPEYMYLRTKKELEEAIDLFEDSDFRYLHISCHGDTSGIDLTFDSLTFEELGKMLAPVWSGKRVFFSSCSVMTEGVPKSCCRTPVAIPWWVRQATSTSTVPPCSGRLSTT